MGDCDSPQGIHGKGKNYTEYSQLDSEGMTEDIDPAVALSFRFVSTGPLRGSGLQRVPSWSLGYSTRRSSG